jgi:hypothetical protein
MRRTLLAVLCLATLAASAQTPRAADLVLTASALSSSVAVGGTATFRTTITSRGPNFVETVLLSVYLPPGVFATSVPFGCADSHSAIQCLFGAVSPNASIPLAFTVRMPATAGPQTVDFSLFTTDIDTDLSNNSRSAVVNVVKTNVLASDADLAVAVGTPTVASNGDTTFVVTLTNKGPAAAANVQIDFAGEANVMLRSVSTPYALRCMGGFSGGSCAATSIGAGAVIPVTFTLRNTDGGSASGTFLAHVGATTHDPDPGNNDAVGTRQ